MSILTEATNHMSNNMNEGKTILQDHPSLAETTDSTIAVIGLGYVGLPLAIAAEQKGFPIIGYDIDERKIERLMSSEANFLTTNELRFLRQSDIKLGSERTVLDSADVFIICVPTPVNYDHTPDLTALIEASRTVGQSLGKNGLSKNALVIVESTISPGTCKEILIPILEYESGLAVEEDFHFAYCPERINPGDSHYSVANIPRVIGGAGEASLMRALSVYQSIIDAQVTPMASIEEAEAVKMVENAFRDINIAFVNELALSFEKCGIDTVNVIRGASTKPFGFMPHYPGCGVGGHCIPVDPYYLIQHGLEHGFIHRFLMDAREINNSMPQHTVDLLKEALQKKRRTLRGSKIALLGLAYKADVGDMRESPALAIREILKNEGAYLATYDPYIPDESTAANLEEALFDAEGVIIATNHDVFSALIPEDFIRNNVKIIIDGRNCLPKEDFLAAGLSYQGIGR